MTAQLGLKFLLFENLRELFYKLFSHMSKLIGFSFFMSSQIRTDSSFYFRCSNEQNKTEIIDEWSKERKVSPG